MKEYVGFRDNEGAAVVIEENGKRRALNPQLKIRNHSPDGFEWGYGGSGPAQLALAIAVDVYGPEIGQLIYQDLKWKLFAPMTGEGWRLTVEQVRAVGDELVKKAEARRDEQMRAPPRSY